MARVVGTALIASLLAGGCSTTRTPMGPHVTALNVAANGDLVVTSCELEYVVEDNRGVLIVLLPLMVIAAFGGGGGGVGGGSFITRSFKSTKCKARTLNTGGGK
jgi:hypothetical protein